ncbi:MAG: response regulator [Lachnospiraceae bacterium]|nr:response regulator [Lachnospiraceae bacterium]
MGKRVMIVDDAAFMRMQIKKMFTECGAEIVAEAGSGEECLAQYEIYKPDLVTMDITMPDMDGITALKLLKEKFPNAKVVMCTAMSQPEKFIESIQAGAFDFIVKPFKKDKIISVLNQV